jgi:hypothetical protein
MRRDTARALGEEAGHQWYLSRNRFPSKQDRVDIEEQATRAVMGARSPVFATKQHRKTIRAWLNGFDDGLQEAWNPRTPETVEERVDRLELQVASFLKVG